MRIQNRYVCEICGTEYVGVEDALECEAGGLPLPMSFLTFGERVPAFGEDGVEWAEIVDVCIENCFYEHRWLVQTRDYVAVSHNLNSSDRWVPARVFDPREGCDAFRYGCSPEGVRIWEETMRRYGFAEHEASQWILDRVGKERARAAEEMARLLED